LQGAAGGYPAAAELVDDLTSPGKQSDITARFPEVPAPKPDLRTSKFRNASGELVLTLGSKSALQQPLLDKNGGLAADFIDFAASSVGDEPRGTEEGRCANAAMVPVAPTPIKSEEPAAVTKVALHSTSEAIETSKKAFEISEDGAPDPLEANLPETALQFKVAPKAELAISCKVCCKSLELYLQAPFQRWCCDLCDRSLTCNDPIWACSTAQACDWGVCSDCGDLLRASYSQAPGMTAGEEEDEPKPARNLAEAASPLAGADESAAVTSKEKQACRCKNCSKQLELHMPGPFQRWICDLCDRHFENQDPMWACSSAKNCNWGVCMDCYEHAGTDVQDDQTSCRSQAPSSCSSVPVPCMVAGAVGFMLGGPLLGLSWALYRAMSLPRNFWEPEDRRSRRRF